MKLGTLKNDHSRDGQLVVVSRDNKKAIQASGVAPNLLNVLENWKTMSPRLETLYHQLNQGKFSNHGEKNGASGEPFDVDPSQMHSPLPRCFQWVDGSAFIHHIVLVRKSRNAALPETLKTSPLMYQGGSDTFLAPTDEIPQMDSAHGTDFEGEVGIIVGDTPMGVSPEDALKYIRLFVLINDVSLRGLVPEELNKGFGFFQSKPSSSFAPLAVTVDELGDAWREGRVHLPLDVEYNGEFFGRAHAGAMHFHFGELVSHAARTRRLTAGTIIGSGTVSNEDMSVGSSCIAEKRMLEKIHEGAIKTPFMKPGDTVKIEMRNLQGENIFGTIFQKVTHVHEK